MVGYGITPVQAIRNAALNPDELLDIEGIAGQIKEGLEADMNNQLMPPNACR